MTRLPPGSGAASDGGNGLATQDKAVPLGEALVQVLEKVMFGTARYIVKKQCDDMGVVLEAMTTDDARRLSERLAVMMRSVYGQKATDSILHELKVVIAKYDRQGASIEKSIQKEEKSRFIFRVPDEK